MPNIRQYFPRFELIPFLNQKAWGLGEDEDSGEEQERGGDELHSEGNLPLSGLGTGNILVDDVIAPVAEQGGELIVDFVDSDKGAANRGG